MATKTAGKNVPKHLEKLQADCWALLSERGKLLARERALGAELGKVTAELEQLTDKQIVANRLFGEAVRKWTGASYQEAKGEKAQ